MTTHTASADFWNALEQQAGKNQLVFLRPFVAIGDRKGGILATLELHVRGTDVRLSFIGVEKENRGQGNASRVLTMLTNAADASGYSMSLTVSPQTMYGDKKAPMNKAALKALYARFGFVPEGRGGDMTRPARTASAHRVASRYLAP